MILSLSTALAAGFYHPAEVAAESEQFARASATSAERATAAQKKARTLAAALLDYEEALDILGIDDRERQEALQTRYQRDFAVLQAFVDGQVERFDAAFGAALERALSPHAGAQRCKRDVPVGRKLPGMAARTERNPDCKGPDLNEVIAASIDADAQLKSDLAALASETWPDFGLTIEPVAVQGERWIGAPAFFRANSRDTLKQIRDADQDARLDFEVAIEQGASKEELQGMVEAARAIDARTAERRHQAFEPALERADKLFAKKAPGAVWCPQPQVLGGCMGTDASSELSALLLADKKFTKALP